MKSLLKNSMVSIAIGILTFSGVVLTNKISALDLLSKREQAETSMRAQMFSSLLEPLVGAKSGETMSVDQEELMVALLALNFHEDFELGPLLRHIDERLAHPARGRLADTTATRLRGELRSIARRVAERQFAGILGTGPKRRNAASVTQVDLAQRGDYCLSVADAPDSSKIGVPSPDGAHLLALSACEPDWVNQTVRVGYFVEGGAGSVAPDTSDVNGSFTCTWYDFPLTDNLLLPDGNRFAVTLRAMHADSTLKLKIVWFPKAFFTPRERPMDYDDVARKVGMSTGEEHWWSRLLGR